MYTLLLGLLLVGEAAALLIGAQLSGRKRSPWISTKNSLYLILDLLSGTLLLLSIPLKLPEIVFWLIFAEVTVSHAFREYEYLSQQKEAFCSNLPLFIVNNIKIVLSMSTAVIHLTLI